MPSHIASREDVLLRRGEHGRDDHRAGVDRAAFERVVVVLAVRGRAVAQRRGGNVEATRMADQGARAGLRGRAYRGLQVIAMARGHTKPGHIHQHRIAHACHGGSKRG